MENLSAEELKKHNTSEGEIEGYKQKGFWRLALKISRHRDVSGYAAIGAVKMIHELEDSGMSDEEIKNELKKRWGKIDTERPKMRERKC